jgi:hypothetical protein
MIGGSLPKSTAVRGFFRNFRLADPAAEWKYFPENPRTAVDYGKRGGYIKGVDGSKR